MGLIGLLIFGCVWHRFSVDIWLRVASVLSVRSYMVVCCMRFIVLLIFGCVLYGFHRVVDIWLCVAWVLPVC